MPRSLNEILPDDLWYPQQKKIVVQLLQMQPAPANIRRDWLFLWALWVGITLQSRDYANVVKGSIEEGPF
jgi:hypothetical protein